MRIITPTQLDSKLSGKESITIIDVNEAEDFDSDNFSSAINIPFSKFSKGLPEDFEKIEEYDEIVLVDDNGDLSRKIATELRKNGFTKVTILEGGLQNWYAQGYE